MSRKAQPPGLPATGKGDSLNSLIAQLEDPRSLLSFLPPDTRAAILGIPEEYLNVEENELLQKFKDELDWEPSLLVETLRVNFWLEYDRVSFSKVEAQMNMSNIYLGVCSRTHFHTIVNFQAHTLAFILARPIGYDATYESLQQLSNRKFHQILSLPIKEAGKINIKLLELQMKTAAMVDLRKQGGYINRSETKNLTVLSQKTEHSYSHAINLKMSDKPADQIERDVKEQLRLLEEEARMQLPPPEPRFEEALVVEAKYTDVTKRDDWEYAEKEVRASWTAATDAD